MVAPITFKKMEYILIQSEYQGYYALKIEYVSGLDMYSREVNTPQQWADKLKVDINSFRLLGGN